MNDLYSDQCGATLEPGDRFRVFCGASVPVEEPDTGSSRVDPLPSEEPPELDASAVVEQLATGESAGVPPGEGGGDAEVESETDTPLPNREWELPARGGQEVAANDERKPGRWVVGILAAVRLLIIGGVVLLAVPPLEVVKGEDEKGLNAPDDLREPPDDRPAVRVALDPGQFGAWVLEASSVLPPVKGLSYGPENLLEGGKAGQPAQTAWVEGTPGGGVGEWVQFVFGDAGDALTFSSLSIVNGYAKTPEVFQKNGRVKELRLSHAEGEEIVQLRDTDHSQTVRLRSPVRSHWIRLTIEGIYPGKVYEDTAISQVFFDIEDFNYYSPLEGRKIPSPDGDLVGWIIPKKRGNSGNSESLVQIWNPIADSKKGMPQAVGSFDHSSESGSHGRVVDEFGWTPDSRFFVYTTFSSGGHSPWHAEGFLFDRKTGEMESLSELGILILQGAIAFEPPDYLIATVQQEPGDLDGARVKIKLANLKK